jgi:hypothetical protein
MVLIGILGLPLDFTGRKLARGSCRGTEGNSNAAGQRHQRQQGASRSRVSRCLARRVT